jgi:hypothetical protein
MGGYAEGLDALRFGGDLRDFLGHFAGVGSGP